jgi:hypothetical protein
MIIKKNFLMRWLLALILLLMIQTFAFSQQNLYRSNKKTSLYQRDSVPAAWRQYDYVEEELESEEFDKPFAIGPNGKRIIKRTKVRRDELSPRGYDEPYFPEDEIPQVFEETLVAVDSSYATVNPVPKGFTGFRVEIVTAAKALPADHDLFFQHGNLYFDQKRNGKYSYMLGAFEKEEEALDYYKLLLEDRYPGGIIIEYKNGNRVE